MPYSTPVATTKIGGASGGTTPGIDTTGATLLVAVITDAGFGTVTVSDSKGNTWTLKTRRTSNNSSMVLAYAWNPTVGTGHTFTLGGGNIFSSMVVSAFPGALTSSDPFDLQNGATSNAATSLATGSITPSEANCLVIAGIVSTNGTGGFSINGSFSIADQLAFSGGQHNAVGLAYLIQAAAAAANPSWSWTDSAEAAVAIASFKAAAGGAGTAAVTGTATDAGTSSKDLREVAGKTFIATLTDDTFIASFTNTDKQNLLNGLVAAVTQTNGWNNQRSNIDHTTAVARTSANVATLTLPALPGVHLDHDDVLEWTIPGSVLTGGSPIVATPTVRIAKVEPDPFAKVIFRVAS